MIVRENKNEHELYYGLYLFTVHSTPHHLIVHKEFAIPSWHPWFCLCIVSRSSVLFLHLLQKKPWISGTGFWIGQMPFMSPQQHCWSTETKSAHPNQGTLPAELIHSSSTTRLLNVWGKSCCSLYASSLMSECTHIVSGYLITVFHSARKQFHINNLESCKII